MLEYIYRNTIPVILGTAIGVSVSVGAGMNTVAAIIVPVLILALVLLTLEFRGKRNAITMG